MKVASTFVATCTVMCGLLLSGWPAGSAVNAGKDAPRLAIRGYDPVSYFTPGEPTPGSAAISYEWDGTRWLFADAAHRELFERNPEAYAPQYGGYCALGMKTAAQGQVDPEAWTIVGGKLYLNYDKASMVEWRQNLAANIARADQNWAKLKP